MDDPPSAQCGWRWQVHGPLQASAGDQAGATSLHDDVVRVLASGWIQRVAEDSCVSADLKSFPVVMARIAWQFSCFIPLKNIVAGT